MPAPGAEGGRDRASYCGMRAIWKGAVSFGLVNVPVRLYSATENHDVQFRQVHREDGGRIRYKRICSVDGAEVSFDDIAKGFETEDGQMVKSCTMLAAQADGHEVTTVEGLEQGGELDPVQKGFIECHGLQCGFCTPGMMMTGRWLLDNNPHPSEGEIREAISGQICRCTGYKNIVKAIQWAADNPATSEVTA